MLMLCYIIYDQADAREAQQQSMVHSAQVHTYYQAMGVSFTALSPYICNLLLREEVLSEELLLAVCVSIYDHCG